MAISVGSNLFWLGINEVASPGTWVYLSSGEPISSSYLPWRSGKPDGNEPYLGMVNVGGTYYWDDFKVTNKMWFVCMRGKLLFFTSVGTTRGQGSIRVVVVATIVHVHV